MTAFGKISNGDGGATGVACCSSSYAMWQTMKVLDSALAMKAAALSEAFVDVRDGDGGATWMTCCSLSRAIPRTMKEVGSWRARAR